MGAVNVKLDFDELKKMQDQLDQIGNAEAISRFYELAAKELAARLLAKVIKRTPVGSYDIETGKKGGTLRRGWTGGTASDATAYANSLQIEKSGSDYTITITNPVEYASYVEYGHRQEVGRYVPALGKRLKQAWIEGQFMLTMSEDEIRNSAPAILQKKLTAYLRGFGL